LAQKWIEYDKAAPGSPLKSTQKGLELAVDEVAELLKKLEAGNSAEISENLMKDYKKRNLVDKR
jgi:hypothetical protein